jgi:hypothetical protein
MGKQLVNFITCGCESSASIFCNLQGQVRTHAVLVIGLYELLGNPTTTRALDIIEILLKVVLNTINQPTKPSIGIH